MVWRHLIQYAFETHGNYIGSKIILQWHVVKTKVHTRALQTEDGASVPTPKQALNFRKKKAKGSAVECLHPPSSLARIVRNRSSSSILTLHPLYIHHTNHNFDPKYVATYHAGCVCSERRSGEAEPETLRQHSFDLMAVSLRPRPSCCWVEFLLFQHYMAYWN